MRRLITVAEPLRTMARAWLALLLWISLPYEGLAAPGSSNRLPTLTSVGAVHLLTSEQAARQYPVHLKATISYYDPFLNYPGRPVLMVTDATGSIYAALKDDWRKPFQAGQLVELTGRSDSGDFGPNISDAHIDVIGQGSLPPHPPRETLSRLMTGSEDAQWVELEGLIESVQVSGGNVTMKLAIPDGEVATTTVKEAGADYTGLIDAKVRMHGIAGSLFNRRGQIIGVQLLFPNLAAVTVEQPAPENPFGMPITPIKSVMRYVPGKNINHRVHIRGTVALFWPGRLLCMQNGLESICSDTTQQTPLAAGQTADVVGFPKIGGVTPSLSDALYQPAPERQPVLVTAIDGNQALDGEHHGQLVQIDGVLVAHDRGSLDPTIVVSSGNFNYSVSLPSSEGTQALQQLQDGSKLRIIGICSVQADSRVFTRHDGYPVTKFFQIMLRSNTDVVVLEKPSWWTAEHTLRVLAAALAITLVVLGGVIYLGVRVRKQTELLQYQATHDGLTGIWNRKAVLDLLRREADIAARANKRIGVVMLDADHFKRVNDTYGHLAGDAVLKELAKRIQKALRSYDLTGRYGGEEFLIVLPGCTEEDVLMCAERVRASVADNPIHAEGADLVITVSVGTAILDPLSNTQRDALAAADGALYQAKHSGRNRVVSGHLEPQLPAAELKPQLA